MNSIKKTHVFLALVLGLLVVGLVAVGVTHALGETNDMPTLVQRIAEKFGLPQADVQQVFDEFHQEKRGQMEAKWEERLSVAVSEGKITEQQKQAVISKHKEIEQKMMELKDKSPEERRAEMQKLHEEFRSWADENNINLREIAPFGHGFKHGFRTGFWMGKHH